MKRLAIPILLLSLGCVNPEIRQQSIIQKRGYRTYTKQELELILLEDCADGKLDMPFERAVLIATETEPLLVNYYEQEIKALSKKAGERIDNSLPEQERARVVFDFLKREFTPRDGMYKIGNTLTTKIGNCISLSIIFDLLCSRNKINVEYMATFDHVFNSINGNYMDITSETGKPKQYHLENETLQKVSRLDILARLYNWRAVYFVREREIEKAEEMFEKGLLVSPSDKLTLDNLIQMYFHNGRFSDSLKWIQEYIKYYPDEEGALIYKEWILERIKQN